ncbi:MULTISPECIES: type II toxin-antitoxin system YafQ family toxin [Selenomonas]|uniref:Addiction module toxin, RelE/StbE family n=1 Tax=Selenomonas flueggei ATCC 43531 TaxID=638302 RepID=C4V184_9FIRM|nr:MULTISPECIES: type II toxin-antitoxin system YafQ family toxin [Selenomonas]EEQ49420.1 addiction module toxin, RelE/StbE family [Selenomonas flueggei ATCC 43531]EFM22873.1 addiction module toxin, RelE/StbE family [Selenomonas sp. oral taxon 149 str. 67H29BP]
MKYIIRPTSRFQRDLKRAAKRGYHTELLTAVIKKLADGVPLEQRYRDHALAGDYAGCRECHITPDWLLIYEIDGDTLLLYLMRTGTHSDLFKM